jgi:hypothetical protein
MDFEIVENDIVARLQAKIVQDNLTIIPIPEDETEILPVFGQRQIIVAFANEEADADENTSIVTQNTHNTFSVLLQGKKLRGVTGLYPLAELVKAALIGFKPTDCRELIYSNHRFVKNDKKVFEYVLDFKTEGTRVQVVDDESFPPLVDVNYIEP